MNWNEVIDNEIKDARGDLKFVGGKGTKTLLIQPNFSRALLYPMRETDKPENPLQVHSKFSRFNFVLIDTDDDKHKAVTTTLAIHRGSSLEYDIFHERMMDAFDMEKPYVYGLKKKEEAQEAKKDRLSLAFSVKLKGGDFAGQTPVQACMKDPKNGPLLVEYYKTLQENESENHDQMEAIAGAYKLQQASLIGDYWTLERIRSAYTATLSMKPFKGMTPAQALMEDPENKGKLEYQYTWLEKNLSQYPKNKEKMDAITAANRLYSVGMLNQEISEKKSVTVYDSGFKPNKYKEEAGLSPCSEIRVKLYHGDDSPFEIEIENYKAPVKETDDGRWNVKKAQADPESKAVHTIRLSFDDARAMVREMERQVNGFFYANYAKADQEANNLEIRWRKEAKEKTCPASDSQKGPSHSSPGKQDRSSYQNDKNTRRPETDTAQAPAEEPSAQDYDYFFMQPENDYIEM